MSNLTPIRVTGTVTTTPSGTQDVNIVGQAITVAVSAVTLPLPTGAATEATLLAAKLDLDQFIFSSGRLLVDGSGVTQPVSGTVTANQGTSPWVVSGTVTANAGTNLNTSALLLDATFTSRINTLGQKTMANSTPIVIASDQSTINVAGTTSPVQTTKAVYSTTIPTLIPGAAPTDILVIVGSATKTVKVMTIELFTSQNVAGTNDWLLFRRSTDDTGGTPVSLTPRTHDTTNPAATAILREYLANPTLGTSAGIVARARITSFDSTTVPQNGFVFDFIKSGYDQGIVLRGTSEILALNFNGAAVPAGFSMVGTITHSEE